MTNILDTRGSAEQIKFDFEDFIKNELKIDLTHTPASQQTKSTINDGKIGVCNYFLKGHCWKGVNCMYRHLSREDGERAQTETRTVVCKHWLRGLCKKGDSCEFLHEYNMKKMPECSFFSLYGRCTNGDECQYQHVNPDAKVKECLWYARGFCKHGAKCRSRHVRKQMCQFFRFGFCPDGPNCSNSHPSFDLPLAQPDAGNQLPIVMPAMQQQQRPPPQYQQQH